LEVHCAAATPWNSNCALVCGERKKGRKKKEEKIRKKEGK
jgi:hypothetical protein